LAVVVVVVVVVVVAVVAAVAVVVVVAALVVIVVVVVVVVLAVTALVHVAAGSGGEWRRVGGGLWLCMRKAVMAVVAVEYASSGDVAGAQGGSTPAHRGVVYNIVI
jgi:hypothetical protein